MSDHGTNRNNTQTHVFALLSRDIREATLELNSILMADEDHYDACSVTLSLPDTETVSHAHNVHN